MPDKSRCMLFLFLLLFSPVVMSLAAGAQAQGSSLDPRVQPRNELGFFAVLPLANGSLKGVTSDRHFFLFGISYSRLLGHGHVCDIRWVSEIMPFEFLAEPFIKGTNIQTLNSVSPFTETRVTYGVGTNPIGADVVFLPGKRWQPFTGVHGGFSYFTHKVLASEATKFNFMLDGRAGLRFPFNGGKSLAIAYMFQHMSNAYIVDVNPGVDSHMIHVEYAFPFPFKRAK
jgi:lipid A 3-O-deacylase PagL